MYWLVYLAVILLFQAVVLGEYLSTYQHEALRGQSVLELGAGTGVAGILASKLGEDKFSFQ